MSKSTSYKILKKAVESLQSIENEKLTIDIILDKTDWESRHIKECVSDILFNYFRHKVLVDGVIEHLTKKVKRKIFHTLAVSFTQSFYQTGIPAQSVANIAVEYASDNLGKSMAGLVNAVQRNGLKKDIQDWEKELKIKSYLPPILLKTWRKNFSDKEISKLEKAFLSKANLTFRITKNLNEEDISAICAEKVALPWEQDNDYYEISKAKDLFKQDWLENGDIYIQDPTTSLAPSFIKVDKAGKIWDTCAAPGGKSLLLASKVPDGVVIASDRSNKRQEKTRENVEKSEFSNIIIKHENALDSSFNDEEFDAILIDAPCSNTGVFRRRPDSLWNFSNNKVRKLIDLQYDLLLNISKKLKVGGSIVYSTCSIEKDENHNLISKFLQENQNFILEKELQVYPSEKFDGGYAAQLYKKKNPL